MLVRSVWLMGARDVRFGSTRLVVTQEDAAGRVRPPEAAPLVRRPGPRAFTIVDGQPVPRLRALAIVPVFNEADVIRHVVEDLITNGLDVYVLDNRSTDGSADLLDDLVGRGVVAIEQFPDDAGHAARNRDQFVLMDQLRRCEEIVAERSEYDWYLIADADEFRESPFPETSLVEGLGIVDAAGFNAVNFELYNFRPTDDQFVPGTDVREHLTRWEPGESFDIGQVKAWRNPGRAVDLKRLHTIGAEFPHRRVFPIPFILRHYPLRDEITDAARCSEIACRASRPTSEPASCTSSTTISPTAPVASSGIRLTCVRGTGRLCAHACSRERFAARCSLDSLRRSSSTPRRLALPLSPAGSDAQCSMLRLRRSKCSVPHSTSAQRFAVPS